MGVKLSKQVKQDLKGVVALMEANIDHINMGEWLRNVSKEEAKEGIYPCGTVGCIAGFVNFFHGYEPKFFNKLTNETFEEFKSPRKATKVSVDSREYVHHASLAKVLMGIEVTTDMDFLFHTDHWPKEFEEKYNALQDEDEDGVIPVENREKIGKLVVKRLKHFIRTGA